MVTTIQKFGKTIATPSAFVTIDARGLEPVGLASLGPVAIIGQAEGGGKSASQLLASPNFVDELLVLKNPSEVFTAFRSGDLPAGCNMTFNPSDDPQIPGGAVEIIAIKVNPSIPSSGSLLNAKGPIINVTSRERGLAQDQVRLDVTVPALTNRTIEVSFEGNSEVKSELGAVGIGTLKFYPPVSNGWDTMSAQVRDDGVITAVGTRAINGRRNEVTAGVAGYAIAVYTAADYGKTLRVFGLVGGVATYDDIVLSAGASPKSGVKFFDAGKILASKLSAPAVAAVTVELPLATPLMTYVAADQYKGMVPGSQMYVAQQKVAIRRDIAVLAADVLVFGTLANGAYSGEKLTSPATVLGKIIGALDFSLISDIIVGEVDNVAPEVLTISAHAAETSSSMNSLSKVQDYFDSLFIGTLSPVVIGTGFAFLPLTGALTALPTVLDEVGPSNVFSVAITLTNMVDAVVAYLHTQSGFVDGVLSVYTKDTATTTITPVISTLYSITVGGVTATFLSTTAVAADIQAGLVAAINATPGMKNVLVASASGAADVLLTAKSGLGFAIPTVGANLSVPAYVAGNGQKTAPSAVAAQYLFGGAEGVTTQQDWDAGFALLRKLRVRTVVPLSGDPSVHESLKNHLNYVTTLGLNEQDGVVGLSALDGLGEPTGVLPNKASIKAQIVKLNSKNIRACAQSINRFDVNGVEQTYAPWFQACIVAGMQAGAPQGLPLTRKLANVEKIAQAPLTGSPLTTGWTPERDSDEMLQAGLWFLEDVRGVGIRNVRNITTHLSSNNLAFIEGSVNDVLNFIVYDWRQDLDRAIGQSGTPSTLASVRTRSAAKLNLYVQNQLIVSWRSLQIALDFDVLKPSVEVAFPPPINFVDATIHLSAANVVV